MEGGTKILSIVHSSY